MKYDYHIIVIGAGSGGLVAAAGAASLGARVALVEAEKMGGDCLNYGCVPSKAFLKSARIAREIGSAGSFGLSASLSNVDITEVMGRVKNVISKIEPHDSEERFTGLGVDVIRERGVLLDKHTVRAGSREITGRSIIIATGSRPAVPPIKGLNDVRYYTNETVFECTKLPEHLIVLGGGPIGLELGQGFRHLGSEVTIIDFLPSLFPKDDPEVGPLMEKVFLDDGMKLSLNTKIIECKKNGGGGVVVTVERDEKTEDIRGDMLLVSLGRSPSTGDMGLERAGVKTTDRGYVITDSSLRTSVKSVYACGDVVGPYQFTHMAGYQAGIVLRNIISPFKTKVDYSGVSWSTYTKPEVAHSGVTEQEAKSRGLLKDTVIVDLKENDRAITEGSSEGFLKFIIGPGGKLVGATCVHEKAGEIISLAAFAISRRLKAMSFVNSIFPYPTVAEVYRGAGMELVKKTFKPWMKKFIKKVFFR
ncbi:dihydrolipoyl dehydrogenase family protein [Spirochaetota bacterium]